MELSRTLGTAALVDPVRTRIRRHSDRRNGPGTSGIGTAPGAPGEGSSFLDALAEAAGGLNAQ